MYMIKGLYWKFVYFMVYNESYDCVVFVDEGGMVEYWWLSGDYRKLDNVFEYKSLINFFEFKKVKFVFMSMVILLNG